MAREITSLREKDTYVPKRNSTKCICVCIYIYIYGVGRRKRPYANQDTLTECEQMRFIFQYSTPFGPHTSPIDVTLLRPHW